MVRPLVRSLLLAALCAAGAAVTAHAGTVYVPVPGLGVVGTPGYQVQISATNTGNQTRPISQVLLPADTDGTQRPTPPTTIQILPGQTALVQPGATFGGLVELSGPALASYSARLVGSGPGRMGVYLPVITSSNQIPAGQTAALQGLVSGSGRAAALALVNLGASASQCTASLLRADGSVIAGPAALSLKPLSQRVISDVFSGAIASEARAAVSCNQSFFTYALLSDAATGEVTYVGPAGSGSSTLTPPGQAGACPAGATCFDAKGIVLQATAANPTHGTVFPVPAGVTTTRLRLSLDVTVGPWYPADPVGKHLIYWFVIKRNFYMPGMLYFRGPGTTGNVALVRQGMGLTHPNKITMKQPFAGEVGHTYHCDNDYDMGRGIYTVTITDLTTGQVAVVLTGVPNVSSYTFKPGDNLTIGMGFPVVGNPDEVPCIGWTYANVHAEIYQ